MKLYFPAKDAITEEWGLKFWFGESSITMEGVSLRVFCFSSLWRMRSSSPVLDLRRGTKKDALPPALGALGRRGVWG